MALSLTSQEPSPQTAICLDAERTLCLSCSIGDERATCTLTFGADTYDAVFALTEVTNPDDTEIGLCVGNYCAGCNAWKRRKQCWVMNKLAGYCRVQCDSGKPCTAGCKPV